MFRYYFCSLYIFVYIFIVTCNFNAYESEDIILKYENVNVTFDAFPSWNYTARVSNDELVSFRCSFLQVGEALKNYTQPEGPMKLLRNSWAYPEIHSLADVTSINWTREITTTNFNNNTNVPTISYSAKHPLIPTTTIKWNFYYFENNETFILQDNRPFVVPARALKWDMSVENYSPIMTLEEAHYNWEDFALLFRLELELYPMGKVIDLTANPEFPESARSIFRMKYLNQDETENVFRFYPESEINGVKSFKRVNAWFANLEDESQLFDGISSTQLDLTFERVQTSMTYDPDFRVLLFPINEPSYSTVPTPVETPSTPSIPTTNLNDQGNGSVTTPAIIATVVIVVMLSGAIGGFFLYRRRSALDKEMRHLQTHLDKQQENQMSTTSIVDNSNNPPNSKTSWTQANRPANIENIK